MYTIGEGDHMYASGTGSYMTVSDREKHVTVVTLLATALHTMATKACLTAAVTYGEDNTSEVNAGRETELSPYGHVHAALLVAVGALFPNEAHRDEFMEMIHDGFETAEALEDIALRTLAMEAGEHGERIGRAYSDLSAMHGGEVPRPTVPERFAAEPVAQRWQTAFDNGIADAEEDRHQRARSAELDRD